MIEKCCHATCGFGGRDEYCIPKARRPDEFAPVVVDMLDALLYEYHGVVSKDTQLVTDRRRQIITRSFSYLHTDPASPTFSLIETAVDIQHETDKSLKRESYDVQVGWHVKHRGISGGSFLTRYAIEAYPKGSVQTQIEQHEVVSGQMKARTMTPYDLEQLHNELISLYELRVAELRDNARVSTLE